ncbi:LysR family transcriptional regulator [Methylopila sp. M107]|uniref:LysR family transcriptional regulator n=1 Tax=Methylopila sp. M107 TaxID=1101190 RepID=UPI00037D3094|nr:LysR family transcriptional regulator [Methylopila sp. M107]
MDINRLDLNLLVALEALLAERNVTRAAKRLRLSQPALSAQLNRLRDLFGDPLMIPAQRGVVPTARALELEAPLRAALDEVRDVLSVGAGFDPAVADMTVSLMGADAVQYALLMPLAFHLAIEAPGVRIAWRTIDFEALPRLAERGDVDVAFMTPDLAPKHMHARTLFDEHYVAIARRGHPRVAGALDLDVFCALDHVVVSPAGGGFSGATDVALAAHGRRRRVALSVPNFLMAPEVVARSDMIALAPSRIVADKTDRLQLFAPPIPVPGFSIAMVWHQRAHAHAAQRWLRERIVRQAG